MGNDDLRGRFRRDFTTEPIKPIQGRPAPPVSGPPTPAHPPPDGPHNNPPPPPTQEVATAPTLAPAKERPARKTSRRFFIGIICLALLAAFIGGFKIWQSRTPIPAYIKTEISIPLLYPGKLPDDYKIVKSSFSATSSTLITYYAQGPSNNRLNFTVQNRPTNFDFQKFYSQSMSNSTTFTTPLGEAAIGKAGGRLLGSLATTKSWVLVTGNTDRVDTDKIQTALANMKEIK